MYACWVSADIGMRLGFEKERFSLSLILQQLGTLPVIDLCQILKQLVRHPCGEVQKI